MESLTPAQQVMAIVHDELETMLGERSPLDYTSGSPAVIMMVGLQGSGKTTTTAKLANYLRTQGQSPLMVAADVYRPAAIDQLITLGRGLELPVYAETPESKPLDIARNAIKAAREGGQNVVLLDTAGRLHIDEAMMDEVASLRLALQANEVILIADAMTGQEAVRVAEEFNARVPLSGLILTKMDGDARGGAALSIRAVTGIPIKFISTGEKMDALEPFYPERMATRILGMGDMMSLIEKAEQTISQDQAMDMEQKLRAGGFDLEDFRQQLQQIKKMGPLTQLMEMIPGMRGMMRGLGGEGGIPQIDDAQFKRIEAIISSMTRQERHVPTIIDGSRRRRIARGSGTSIAEINQLLVQFKQMQKMMKQLTSMRGGRGMPSMGSLPGMLAGRK
jgi:signal recognition particle subunit SRP54